jgi:predicted dehydrogenase
MSRVKDEYEVAVVGTGPNPNDPGPEGYGMGYRHAEGYRDACGCELVACADIVREHAQAFADEFSLEAVYTDYEEMLRDVEPDVVSVCVPPASHAEIVHGCASSGVVDAIHCEKPMAKTWDECEEMVRAADDHGVQLTFNHQRRFGAPFRTAKTMVDEDVIGELTRLEFSEVNIYDAGSHLFDLCNYYVDQTPAEWVIGQIDYREENVWFGAHNENQALVQWKYENGVFGLASTGTGAQCVGCYLRLIGSDGAIELGVEEGPTLRVKRQTSTDWEVVETGESIHAREPSGPIGSIMKRGKHLLPLVPEGVENRLLGLYRRVAAYQTDANSDGPTSIQGRALQSVVRGLETNEEPELGSTNALAATELVFAAWESARRTGRVELPIDVDDNPLDAMIDEGTVLREDRSYHDAIEGS